MSNHLKNPDLSPALSENPGTVPFSSTEGGLRVGNIRMKDPAFLFYSQDFFTGTATMSFEDRGKYITILCLMHQQGRMTEETIRFIVGSISVNLKSKFRIDENGLWYNARLEIESEKRAKFVDSRRDNGEKGGRPKKPNAEPTINHMDNHMGNLPENENENLNRDTTVNNKYSADFLTFWEAYPKKVGKDGAFKSWQKKKDKPPITDILEKLHLQKQSNDWQKDSGQYIPMPATYINQGRWYDEIKKKVLAVVL